MFTVIQFLLKIILLQDFVSGSILSKYFSASVNHVNSMLRNDSLYLQYWSNAERLCAIDQLIELCEPTQVRHMMAVIEPQFQRDFISLLPKELALYVLSFLTPRDLTRAAQTCRCWRVLAEDNLLWREKCREAGIDDVRDTLNKRRLRGSSHHSTLSCGLSSPTGSSQNPAPIITPSPWKVNR
jgi:hypothetical protein